MRDMDAWMSTDNKEDHGVAVGRTESRVTHSRSSSSEQSVVASLRRWLLQEYVKPYSRSLAATRIFRRCYWIDGVGLKRTRIASGQRQNDGQHEQGMTGQEDATVINELREIRALGQELARESKPITLYGFLLSADSKRHAHKGKRKGPVNEEEAIMLPRESDIIKRSWLEIAPALLQEMDQSPAIFLLNPLVPQVFSYEQMTPLYQRAVPTDLCLLISHKQLTICLQDGEKVQEQGAVLTALLRSDRWKLLPKGDAGQKEASEETVAGFCTLLCASMQRHFQIPPQHMRIPMQAGSANVVSAPYTLIYATRRQDSLLRMNDATCLHWRQSIRQSYVGVLGEEWFVRQEDERQAVALRQLAQQVRQMGEAQRTRRWPDLRQQLVLAQFGKFTQREYDGIIQQFLEQHIVRCTWKQVALDETEQVPEQNDTLIWG